MISFKKKKNTCKLNMSIINYKFRARELKNLTQKTFKINILNNLLKYTIKV